jgi:hypothetical protein
MNLMPIRSHVSRSTQSALRHTFVSVWITAPSPSLSPTRAFTRSRCFFTNEYRCVTTSKRGSRSG